MNLAMLYYLLRLKEALPCKRKEKRGILSIMANSLSEYRIDHRKFSFEDLAQYVGTPEMVAAAYCPDCVIPSKRIVTCKVVLKIVLYVLLGLLVLVGVYFLVIFLLQYFASVPVYVNK